MNRIRILPQRWESLTDDAWWSHPACYQIERDMVGDHPALITLGFTAQEPIGCNSIGTYDTLAHAKAAVRRHYVKEMTARVGLQ